MSECPHSSNGSGESTKQAVPVPLVQGITTDLVKLYLSATAISGIYKTVGGGSSWLILILFL